VEDTRRLTTGSHGSRAQSASPFRLWSVLTPSCAPWRGSQALDLRDKIRKDAPCCSRPRLRQRTPFIRALYLVALRWQVLEEELCSYSDDLLHVLQGTVRGIRQCEHHHVHPCLDQLFRKRPTPLIGGNRICSSVHKETRRAEWVHRGKQTGVAPRSPVLAT